MSDLLLVDLLRQMGEADASDLFLTEGLKPAWRVFGEMVQLDELPELDDSDFVEFVDAFLPPGTLDRLETERDLDLGVSLAETERYRLNLFYQKNKRSLVARRVPLGNLEFDNLGLPDVLKSFSKMSRGLLLITGSTGSGKSSTMAALLHRINSKFPRHIVTIEDPIEFIHNDIQSRITQREVGNDTLDFNTALKHVVRQSPDVIF